MSTINQIQDEIIEEFSLLDDWMDRYEMIIDMGNDLPPMPEAEKTPDHIIEGCQSRVWINGEVDSNGLLQLRADSDAVIVKGIIAMLLKVLSGQKPADIANADLYFIDKVGLKEHLSPTRSNGLLSMVRHIKLLATTQQ
ncbi:Cysteine desulfuration protein SufE [Porphyromonas levii]|uniref:SufE family protein n=1 Tax=Porphyromonas levii TaxID=28114 RepID=A0A4Y8WPJ2_9PORP|nr:SufE family protein [Porphyromonas levii]MBR8730227.1 Cysteine desulfuration protein SufE [Porphyromonas levii]MBR8763432.1 Cysteine desulfuration protein SufE [Porphyromonas levii]MBR8773602.1 Cysteine desulfuration protein SufE [Porphyromonas levii]MBR8784876.1 Cysteine desulfuration protein SufE [Porphyromonas levii]TFH95036.1 SufE family protein [Porphyromonas levii]